MKCDQCSREMEGVCGGCGKAYCERFTCSTLMQRILGLCRECYAARRKKQEEGL